MVNRESKDGFRLRHSVLLLPLYVVLVVGVVYIGIHGAGILFMVMLIIILSCLFFVSFWHNVTYKDGVITGVLFPYSPVSIKLSDITKIKRETDLLRFETRRCMAIYDENHKKVIKVSLAIFIHSDLSKLIQTIRESRPDLPDLGVPDYWLGSKW
jgi:hypothetical protein